MMMANKSYMYYGVKYFGNSDRNIASVNPNRDSLKKEKKTKSSYTSSGPRTEPKAPAKISSRELR